VIALLQVVIYVLAVLGSVRLLRSGGQARLWGCLLLISAAAFILIPGPVGNGRFRLPAEPLLALMAGFALPPGGVAPIRIPSGPPAGEAAVV
jgi:hypothetical protein